MATIDKINEILAEIKSLKSKLIKAQDFENAAILRDMEKFYLEEIEDIENPFIKENAVLLADLKRKDYREYLKCVSHFESPEAFSIWLYTPNEKCTSKFKPCPIDYSWTEIKKLIDYKKI